MDERVLSTILEDFVTDLSKFFKAKALLGAEVSRMEKYVRKNRDRIVEWLNKLRGLHVENKLIYSVADRFLALARFLKIDENKLIIDFVPPVYPEVLLVTSYFIMRKWKLFHIIHVKPLLRALVLLAKVDQNPLPCIIPEIALGKYVPVNLAFADKDWISSLESENYLVSPYGIFREFFVKFFGEGKKLSETSVFKESETLPPLPLTFRECLEKIEEFLELA